MLLWDRTEVVKSTLSKVIAGHPAFEVTEGSVEYKYNGKNNDLLEWETHERSQRGIFLGMQYPVKFQVLITFSF